MHRISYTCGQFGQFCFDDGTCQDEVMANKNTKQSWLRKIIIKYSDKQISHTVKQGEEIFG